MRKIATLQLLAGLCCSLVFTSCATKYNAPNPAKVNAATAKVKQNQQKISSLNREAQAAIKESQGHADALIVVQQSISEKIDALIKVAPPEMQAALADIKVDSNTFQIRADALVQSLQLAHTKQNNLEQISLLQDVDLFNLEIQQKNYFSDSQKLADKATEHSADLAWYKRRWWATWIVAGAGLILAIILALFKWGAKWAVKLNLPI